MVEIFVTPTVIQSRGRGGGRITPIRGPRKRKEGQTGTRRRSHPAGQPPSFPPRKRNPARAARARTGMKTYAWAIITLLRETDLQTRILPTGADAESRRQCR
jgi:hypothetical protein